MKAIERRFKFMRYCSVSILYKVVLTFVNYTLVCDHSNESYWAVLSCGTERRFKFMRYASIEQYFHVGLLVDCLISILECANSNYLASVIWNLDHSFLWFGFRAKLVTADTFKLDRLLKAACAFVVPGHGVFTSEGEGLLGVVTQQL